MDQIKKMTFTKLHQVSFSLLQNEGLHEMKAPRNPQEYSGFQVMEIIE